MATERVTRNRTGPEPLETVPESEPFATGSEPRNPETAGKKLLEPDLRTAGRFTWTTSSLESEPKLVRENRPSGSLEPSKK